MCPGKIIKRANKTFQKFIKTKIRAAIGSFENIKLRKYDNNI